MPYATLTDLTNRLDWELDDDEVRIATAALEDASDLAAHHGRDWPDDAVPRLVRTLVLRACKRYMDNPNGYTQSRAGDETLAWSDDQGENAGTVYFTDDEIKLLAGLAGKKAGLASAQVSAWGTVIRCREPGRMDPAGLVPVDYDGRAFPLFSDGGPW